MAGDGVVLWALWGGRCGLHEVPQPVDREQDRDRREDEDKDEEPDDLWVPRMPSIAYEQHPDAWTQARRASSDDPLIPLPDVLPCPSADPTDRSQ